MITPITKAEFDTALAKNPYYNDRWGYFEEAIQQSMALKPCSVLELGCLAFPLFRSSVVMDRAKEVNPHIVHDATTIPWPVADKTFDLFMALQVWEHLGTNQQAAFSEVRRVAKTAVLSFPLMWKCRDPKDVHHAISMETIEQWTLGTTPKKVVIMPPWHVKRAIYVFDFQAG